MPLSLTTFDGTSVVLEGNFEDIEDYLRSGVVANDLAGTVRSYKLERFISGKLHVARAGTWSGDPLYANNREGIERWSIVENGNFDLTYRKNESLDMLAVTDVAKLYEDDIYSEAFELLGRPGPSFVLEYMEEGLTPPSSPSIYNKYPKNLCYSRWLTVPGCSIRIWVPYSAMLKISGRGLLSGNMFRSYWMSFMEGYTYDGSARKNFNNQMFHFLRFGIFVDTNPVLDTEFVNANPNILDESGATAPYVSWRKVEEETVFLTERTRVDISGTTRVQGGKWYNVSFKVKTAGTRGWHDGSWHYTNFESSAGDFATRSAAWLAEYLALFGAAASAANSKYPWFPSYIRLWEMCGISVEIDYGRLAETDDSSSSELNARPNT